MGDSYVYELCLNVTGKIYCSVCYNFFKLCSGPKVCIDPPKATDYGYLNRTWDGSKEIQISKVRKLKSSHEYIIFSQVSYYCEPPRLVMNYNGSAVYDIWCSAANFPKWQFTQGYNDLPSCA